MKRVAGALFAGVLLLIAGWTFLQTKDIASAEHDRFVRALAQVRRLDAGFSQDVLRVRHRLLEDYDSLGLQITEMQQALADLSPVPGFVEPQVRALMEAAIRDMSRLVDEKADRVERFKSQNAVLKNSLSYFPLAGRELATRLATGRAHAGLEKNLNRLMGEVLAYNVAPGSEQEQEIRQTLAQLDQWREWQREPREAEVVDWLSWHVRTILQRRPVVDQLVEQLVAGNLVHLATGLAHAYDAEFARAVRSVERYRTLSYGLCLLLAAGVAYALFALRAANRHLEQRVADRTRELDGANRALQSANQKLSGLALYDALTGLPNRLLLESRLEQAAAHAERSGKPLALMFVDLDRFKPVNDTYGHAIGDALLAAVAGRLSACVRKDDTVARTGGDEFVVVLDGIETAADAARVAASILDELVRPFDLLNHRVEISGSVGIGLYPDDARELAGLKATADQAMYDAKRHGRGCYRFFNPTRGLDGRAVAAPQRKAA